MKKYVLFFLLAVAGFVACSKDDFQTTPKLVITGYNTKEIPVTPGGQFVFSVNMDYFDKEGDLKQGMLWAKILRLNRRPSNIDQDTIYERTLGDDTFDMPDRDKGQIVFSLPSYELEFSSNENDTLVFKFALRDRAGNTSDTITSEQIVRLNN